jgi:hypothetical protein
LAATEEGPTNSTATTVQIGSSTAQISQTNSNAVAPPTMSIPKSATCALPLSNIGGNQQKNTREVAKKTELDNIRYLNTSPATTNAMKTGDIKVVNAQRTPTDDRFNKKQFVYF